MSWKGQNVSSTRQQGLALIFSLVVGLYNILEVNTLNKRMDAITAAEEENLVTLKKIISATAGIDDVIDSVARVLTLKVNHENKIFWLQQSIAIVNSRCWTMDSKRPSWGDCMSPR